MTDQTRPDTRFSDLITGQRERKGLTWDGLRTQMAVRLEKTWPTVHWSTTQYRIKQLRSGAVQPSLEEAAALSDILSISLQKMAGASVHSVRSLNIAYAELTQSLFCRKVSDILAKATINLENIREIDPRSATRFQSLHNQIEQILLRS